ncbi:MAG TPA: GDP-mannose 4,6-dehydratase, partial [Chlamydiales bacterium]|nr:GDP-mannose 4,6-dehydratase [Chlamydiales bacterium]
DICVECSHEVDAIYNLACPASPIQYQHDPIRTIKVNTEGMMHLLDLAKKRRIPLLQASTSEVYGDPLVHPQPESYWGHVNPNGPRACYDEGKRIAETLCMEYYRQHGVPVKIARIFNTYGPRMQPNDGRVVSNFVVQALNNEPLTIYGSGEQTRSFCFVDDLIEGLIKLMGYSQSVPVNLGNPQEFSMLELANLVIELTGSKSNICFEPLPIDDPKQRRPDITRAKCDLDWTPKVSLREGLTRTVAYFESHISGRARAI